MACGVSSTTLNQSDFYQEEKQDSKSGYSKKEKKDKGSDYNQKEKQECRTRLIEHAVQCLTEERETSACVLRGHVREVWNQLKENRETSSLTEQEINDVEKEIKNWELFHDSQTQTRKPSDLRVCYLAGDNPLNDLHVFVKKGVLCQNIWAIEKDGEVIKEALENINDKSSITRNVRLFKGDILSFLKENENKFDIIYLDACGQLPSTDKNTLKAIGYIFLHNKLVSPGALITTFSFPPKDTEVEEREHLRELTTGYLKYRLMNTVNERRPNSTPEKNEEFLRSRTDEENYSDYISYQVIDSAYMYIPALRMLSSSSGNKSSLWEQIFMKKRDFLNDLKTFDPGSAGLSQNFLQKLGQHLQTMASGNLSSNPSKAHDNRPNAPSSLSGGPPNVSGNPFCQAWVSEVFPDWQKHGELKKLPISSLLLTHLMTNTIPLISKYTNKDFKMKSLATLCTCFQTGVCVVEPSHHIAQMITSLLYGQMAHPSFPVLDKLLRLKYTARQRQMFSDVFIFDKCQYVYNQFPSVDFACSAIYEPRHEVVVKIVVECMKNHLAFICKDVFESCHSTNTSSGIPEGVKDIPKRCDINFSLSKDKGLTLAKWEEKYEEALKPLNECLEINTEDPEIFTCKALCHLKLEQHDDAVACCNEALKLDERNVTALYRRALAYKEQEKISNAVQDLKKLLSIDSAHKDAQRELEICRNMRDTDLRRRQLLNEVHLPTQESCQEDVQSSLFLMMTPVQIYYSGIVYHR